MESQPSRKLHTRSTIEINMSLESVVAVFIVRRFLNIFRKDISIVPFPTTKLLGYRSNMCQIMCHLKIEWKPHLNGIIACLWFGFFISVIIEMITFVHLLWNVFKSNSEKNQFPDCLHIVLNIHGGLFSLLVICYQKTEIKSTLSSPQRSWCNLIFHSPKISSPVCSKYLMFSSASAVAMQVWICPAVR